MDHPYDLAVEDMMRSARFLTGFFVAPLLLVLTSAFAEPEATLPEPAVSPTPPKDIMLVLDNSGSMKKNDPQFLMRKMVSAFADGLAPDSRLGLVLFDEKVHRVLGLTAADTPDFKDTIGASLKRLDYSGKLTDIPAGVERAIYELRQLGRPEAKRIIIFLTDGIVDLGNRTRNFYQARWLRESLVEQAKVLAIPIFGIALSEAADFQLIQSVAQASGGDYYRVLAASDIPATFEQIRSRIEAAPAEPHKKPKPEPVAETAPPSEPIPAPVEPVAGTDQPPTTPESVSGWEKIPAEWRPWLLLAFGFIVLGIVGVVAVGRSRRDKPKLPMPVAMLYDLGLHTKKTAYPLKSITRIGRDKNSDIVIPYNTVSSHHAVIEFRDGLFYLRDLRSTNGTFLNTKRISDTHTIQEVGLKHGDRIRFNACEFGFALAGLEDVDATEFQGAVRRKGTEVRIKPALLAASKPAGEAPLPGPIAEPIDLAEKTAVKPGKCPKHPLWNAVELCSECQQAKCNYCIIEKAGRRLCKDCARRLDAA
jgi:FHA domain/von Willebrand factor type A domain